MRGGDAIGADRLELSGSCGNEFRYPEQGARTDGYLRAELHVGCLGRQHPGWNLERRSRWIAHGYRPVATTGCNEYF